jgi:hypothetical protein
MTDSFEVVCINGLIYLFKIGLLFHALWESVHLKFAPHQAIIEKTVLITNDEHHMGSSTRQRATDRGNEGEQAHY